MLCRLGPLLFVAACAGAPARPPREEPPEDAGALPVDASIAVEREALDAGVSVAIPRESRPPFVPEDTGAPWTAIAVPNEGDEGPVMYRTVLHPDAARALTDLYVVAIDLSRVALHAVAGTAEPKATTPEGKSASRQAMIPAAARPALLAAFNGGWKSEHGHYGMKVDGVVLVAPTESNCTVAGLGDDTIRIGPWKTLAPEEARMRFFRQAPPCLVVRGTRHSGLSAEMTTAWGADEKGDPLIRRSALGTNESGTVLYFGIGNSLTARALAEGMRRAGAVDVAELDVNWSYPKFLVFQESEGKDGTSKLEASSLFPNFVFDKAEYVRRRSERDFFYLTRK